MNWLSKKKFILILGLTFFVFIIHCQSYLSSKTNLLDSYYVDENYKEYFKLLGTIKDSTISKKDYLTLTKIENYYGKYFEFSCDSIDSTFYRKQYMYLAHTFWSKFGDYDKSLNYYLKAHFLTPNKQYLDEYAWYIENEIASIYTRKDDFERAHYFYILANEAIDCIGNKEQKIKLLINRGICFQSEKKYKEAEKYFTDAFNSSMEHNYLRGILSTKLHLSQLHMDHAKYELAKEELDYCKTKLKFYKQDKDYLRKWVDFNDKLGLLNEKQGNLNEAAYYYEKEVAIFNDQINTDFRRELSKTYYKLAQLFFTQKQYDEANKYVDLGLRKMIISYQSIEKLDSNKVYSDNSIIDLLFLKGKIEIQLSKSGKDINNFKKSAKCFELALYTAKLARETLIGDESKLISINQNKSIINELLDVYWKLFSTDNKSISLDLIQNLFDKSKSILLESKNKKNKVFLALNNIERSSIIDIDNKILNIDENFDPHNNDKLFKERVELISKKNKLLNKYRSNISFNRLSGNVIEYACSDSSVYSLSNINGVKKFTKISNYNNIKELVNEINQFLVSRSRNDSCLKKGFNILIQPIINHLPENLTIIPDGLLEFIQFDILKKDDLYLIEYCVISYNYINRNVNKRKDKLNILCYYPEYLQTVVASERSSLYKLIYSSDETKNIQKEFGNKNVQAVNFINKKDFFEKLKIYNVFHFSGHAIANDSVSYLATSDFDKIYASEISNNTIPLRMAVLSGCETGLGKYANGEGVRSLGKSFIEAGTMAVVYSLWKVNDESASKLMKSFYENLNDRLTISSSLRKAKIDFLNKANVENKHPYYWSSFVGVGNCTEITYFWTNTNIFISILIISLALIFIYKIYKI